MRCSSYCIAENLNKQKISDFFSKNFYAKKISSALYISLSENEDLFFIYGALIFWNVTEQRELLVIKQVRKLFKHRKIEQNVEILEYDFGENESVKLDKITINNQNSIFSKLAVSYGLAQSSMLSYFEDKVGKAIDQYQSLVVKLSQKGYIPISNKEVSQNIGKLFLVRSDINMHSDILDDPLFVWDNPSYEALYKESIVNMNLTSRTNILNKRLDIIQDLFYVLNNQISSNHSSRLEWIIIWLIFIEIILTLIFNIKL